MKIIAIETIQLAEFPNLCWVQVCTDEGPVGLGEAFFGAAATVAYIHESAAPRPLGQEQRRLPGRVRGADDVDVVALRRARLVRRCTIEDPASGETGQPVAREQPVRHASRDDDCARLDHAAVIEAHGVDGAALLALAALYFLLPQLAGLEDTWRRIEDGSPYWTIVELLFGCGMFFGYVAMFRGIFLRAGSNRIDWRASYQITMAGLAAGVSDGLAWASGRLRFKDRLREARVSVSSEVTTTRTESFPSGGSPSISASRSTDPPGSSSGSVCSSAFPTTAPKGPTSSTRAVGGETTLPLPLVAAVCGELRPRGVLTPDRPARLTPAGAAASA